MTRRDAVAALVGMPAITRIAAAPVAPADVIVVDVRDKISPYVRADMTAQLLAIWPGRRILILDGGMTLRIVQGTIAL